LTCSALLDLVTGHTSGLSERNCVAVKRKAEQAVGDGLGLAVQSTVEAAAVMIPTTAGNAPYHDIAVPLGGGWCE
jgi:hypothetical protein